MSAMKGLDRDGGGEWKIYRFQRIQSSFRGMFWHFDYGHRWSVHSTRTMCPMGKIRIGVGRFPAPSAIQSATSS